MRAATPQTVAPKQPVVTWSVALDERMPRAVHAPPSMISTRPRRPADVAYTPVAVQLLTEHETDPS